jgi:N-acetylneuraminate 9-O-acetyltransferase
MLAEWSFRSGLDRYVWIWGMVVAWVHPHIEVGWKVVDSMRSVPRFAARSGIMAVVAVVGYFWYVHVYCLPKLEYNKVHPYTSWIPLTLWIVARNLTPALRCHSLAFFGWLGCVTLETYIGQFHIWLRSNIPDGQPMWILDVVRINTCLASALVPLRRTYGMLSCLSGDTSIMLQRGEGCNRGDSALLQLCTLLQHKQH